MRMLFQIIPATIFVVIAYNVLAFLDVPMDYLVLSRFDLPSGGELNIAVGDVLIAAGLGLLFIELLSATNTRASSVINHGLSMVVFVFCMIEFLLVRVCGTSTFMLITIMTLLDVVAGYSITIVTARRDFNAIHPNMGGH